MILKLHLVFIFQASRSRNIQPKFRLADFFIQLGSFAFATEKQYGGDRLGRRLGVWWEGKKRWRGGGWAGVQSLKISQSAEHRAEPRQSSIPSISAIFVAFSIMSEVCLISWWQLSFSSWDIKRHTGPPAPPHLPAVLLSVKSTLNLLSKCIRTSRGPRFAAGIKFLSDGGQTDEMCKRVFLSKTLNPTTSRSAAHRALWLICEGTKINVRWFILFYELRVDAEHCGAAKF